MSFDYKKLKNHSDSESFWTSYSDLFLGLSSIFLLLYVVASLRSGTDGIQAATENSKLRMEVQDLKNQLQTYENVKDQYLKQQASRSELNEYNELMDKLTLLQQEATEEKDNLRKQASENEQKAKALNKYQQMVRNLINSNKFSKVKIDNRDQVIGEQDEQIETQVSQISDLNKNVQQKEQQIANVNSQLNHNMNQLQQALKNAKLSKAAYNQRVAQLKQQAQNQLQELNRQKQATQAQLAQAQQNLEDAQNQLSSTQGALADTQGALADTQGQLARTSDQVSDLQGQLAGQAADAKAKMDALRSGYANQQAADKAAFDRALANQKNLSAGELAKQRDAFNKAAAAKERKLAGELAGLANQLKDTEGQLAQARAELADRKNVAKQIKDGFDRAGVKADIDMESGDVILDFGNSHFDSDSALLKPEMKQVLQKAMPIYSKSLFGNPKIASKVSAVEVIGFASPTYQGRYIDPSSSSPKDREALTYNMDLSYRRARSIFNHILDEKSMNFQYRDVLVPSLKVSGRSFLDLVKMERGIASAQEYCQRYDCKKTQKVIVRFSMDKRK